MPIAFTLHEDYDVPPARLFRALTDLDDAAHWMTGLVRIERLDSGPLSVGSRWRETRKVFGREATEEFEVTRMDAPSHLSLRCEGRRGTSGRGEYLFDFELEPQAHGSRLAMHGEIRELGRLWELAGSIFGGAYRKAMARDMAALRHHLAKELVTAPH